MVTEGAFNYVLDTGAKFEEEDHSSCSREGVEELSEVGEVVYYVDCYSGEGDIM